MTGIEEGGRTPSGPARLTVSPGISTGTVTIRAEHVSGGRCVAEVYDALGNRVRTLVLYRSGAAASATWNGDDDLGRRLPEGIYYCSLADAANPAVRKLILTR
jgi:flagellar hook assembly protein FlgD